MYGLKNPHGRMPLAHAGGGFEQPFTSASPENWDDLDIALPDAACSECHDYS
jgi:hypothetical protein